MEVVRHSWSPEFIFREMTELTDGLVKIKDREQPLEIFSGFERSKRKHISSWKVGIKL